MHFANNVNALVKAEEAQRTFVQTLTKTFAIYPQDLRSLIGHVDWFCSIQPCLSFRRCQSKRSQHARLYMIF